MATIADRLPWGITLEYILGPLRSCELGKSLVEHGDLTSRPCINSECLVHMNNRRCHGFDIDRAKPSIRTEERRARPHGAWIVHRLTASPTDGTISLHHLGKPIPFFERSIVDRLNRIERMQQLLLECGLGGDADETFGNRVLD